MKHFVTEADVGSVKVGNTTFMVLFPNGYGDGDVDVYVLEENESLPEGIRFFTSFEAKDANIYAYDCDSYRGSEVTYTLNGRYGVYYKGGDDCGSVYFQKWGK